MAPGNNPRGTESLAKIEAFAGEIERYIDTTPEHWDGRSVALSSLAGLQALAESLEHTRIAAVLTLTEPEEKLPPVIDPRNLSAKQLAQLLLVDGVVLGLDAIEVILVTLDQLRNGGRSLEGEQADLYAQLSEARAEIRAAQKSESPS